MTKLLNQNKAGRQCQWAVYVLSYVLACSLKVYYKLTNLNPLRNILFLAIYGSKNLASDSAAKMFKITLPFSLSFRQRSSPCLRLRPPKRVVVCVGGGGRSVAHPVRSPQQQQPRRRAAAARAAAQCRRLQLHAGRPRKFKRSLRQFSILIHLFIYGQYVKLSRANSSATVLCMKQKKPEGTCNLFGPSFPF